MGSQTSIKMATHSGSTSKIVLKAASIQIEMCVSTYSKTFFLKIIYFRS